MLYVSCNFDKRCSWPVIILLLLVSACNTKILDEKPLDFLTPSNAYTTVDGVQQGINGLYATVRQRWFFMDLNPTYALFSLGTDESFDGEEPGGQRFLTDYSTSLVSSNVEVGNMWQTNYLIIQHSNTLIDGINNADPSIWPNERAKNIFLSEAMLFRAFSYRILVTVFGDVPLVTDVINEAKTDFVRAPKADIYKQIEDDLTYFCRGEPACKRR